MVVCKFFLQGNCRFGQNCRNEHPGNANSGGQNQNRFGALANNSGGGNRAGSTNNAADKTLITRDALVDLDSQKARPKWIFSSYAPSKTAAVSLMEDNEYSAEEIRLRYYLAASTGQAASADAEATQMYNKINQDYQNILSNVNSIPTFLENGEKKRPNRHDFTNVALFDGRKSREQFIQEFGSSQGSAFSNNSNDQSTSGFGSSPSGSAFGAAGGSSGSNPFGKPATSTFGQPAGPSAFGSKPAFGQSATPSFGQSSTPAFGQSAFGKPSMGSQPAFGSSGFGQAARSNPFGPASASSGFGQSSSTFGQPSQPAPAFGQQSQPSSGFGQSAQPATAFGQPSQPTSAFGQPSQPTSAFGQPSQPGISSGFGQPSQQGASSTFGQPSQSGSTSGFGQQSQPSSFGQQSGTQDSTFGSRPAFGSAAQPNSVFGQSSQQSNGAATSFGQPATSSASSGFGQGSQQSNGMSTSFGQPSAASTNSGFGQSAAGFGGSNDQAMESESTQRPNPFGVAPSNSAATGFGSQPVQQQTAPTESAGDINPVNPLLNKPAKPLHVTQKLPAKPPTFDMSNRLTSFRGQTVTYIEPPRVDQGDLPAEYRDMQTAQAEPFPAYKRPDTVQMEKIWFPKGPDEKVLDKLGDAVKRLDFEGEEEDYEGGVQAAYEELYETGEFKDGLLPMVPPKREWVSYDF